ncbi:PaaX family transcriptional regulator [Citricoccus muralis]|uniref:PaaX family transcriptional regulator C-terminal domain-containing protein n=1 Tax=Citricoccus muralis TaxID=169134 RepID=A0ABY8H6E9_9MICC|nr:PaaX family transcriptional regulator C-terminal domain-containing protein [Citricoccus muralis]WFP16243.1 PaaX family transcriptional regulator C-terminal domain-containing protein [Citricoccus muralis]
MLFGDYWLGRADPIPSSALVELLSVFGVSETGARAAVQRLAQRGFLVAHRQGRRTSYAVQRETRETVALHVKRLFHSHHPPAWDGTWTLVSYMLPGQETSDRRLLRDELRNLKFGNLSDGVWIRPGDQVEEVVATLQRLDADADNDVGVFRQGVLAWPSSVHHVRAAFDADGLDEEYRKFADFWSPQAHALEREPISGENALRLRTEVMSAWRTLVRKDPQLPADLLSDPAPIQLAATTCAVLYDALGSPAEHAVRRILERHSPELAEMVSHHTFASSLSVIESASSGSATL